MTWGEAVRLAGILSGDPSSQVAAAVLGWDYPLSREAFIGLDQFDLAHWVASGKKPKPHPLRPKTKHASEKRGKKQVLSQERIIQVLREAGHSAPLPGAEQDEVSDA